MNKLYNRIIWENGTTPALNEDNLNAMSKGIDDIDDRVIDLGGAVLDVLPDLEDMLSHAEELKEYRDDAVAAATSAEDDEEDRRLDDHRQRASGGEGSLRHHWVLDNLHNSLGNLV